MDLDLQAIDFKIWILVVLGGSFVSLLMHVPVQFLRNLVNTLWARLLDAPAPVQSNGNGLRARVEELERWKERTQDLFDNGHFVTSTECKLIQKYSGKGRKNHDE